jgi:hypothetical protein
VKYFCRANPLQEFADEGKGIAVLDGELVEAPVIYAQP